MDTVTSLPEMKYVKNSVVTIGTFDGMHRAHERILEEVVARARRRKTRSVVVTFDPHPRKVLGGPSSGIPLLSTVEERQEICEKFGIDVFFVIPFTYEFSRQTPREFYQRYIVEAVGVAEVVEGYDHHFGRDREGSVSGLAQLGDEFGFEVTTIEAIYHKGELVHSRSIRTLLTDGNVSAAATLLGRPYTYSGIVVRGDGRGRSLGYPTANLHSRHPDKLIPMNGIYFVQVEIGSQMFYGMTSIGVRPTFVTHGNRTVEVNVLDFDRDLYGQTIDIHFLERLRDEIRFDSAEELIKQMDKDKALSIQLKQKYESTAAQSTTAREITLNNTKK